ncbi:MAG TPA: DEAD/DEAH box helicase [Spirochaetota bacterium]|nr:DEAD/DEAH box helicase [Spirochaetota bacterium]HPJ36012.1 DEAD/DEAH box helicase [Spirochaetota bacterium]
MNLEKFKELGLSESVLKELQKKGFEEPTEIQSKIIPIFLNDNVDIIGQAQTGTGKTAAFGIPIIEKLAKSTKHTQALILTPTRELAIQVSEELNSFKGKRKLQILPVYGGQSITDQIRRLKNGVDIVVGTPGRILDHIRRKSISLAETKYVVLDEADEMLNMGFIEEVESILSETNPERRTLLFSATMPESIMNIAKKHMKEYRLVSTKNIQLTADLTDQIYFEVNDADRFEALCRIIDIATDFYGLIFCRTKVAVDELVSRLIDRGYDAEAIHGDLSQYQRERTLEKFKKKRSNILVATDVAARGIDVINLSHVINYSLPQDPEAYVHRIGRTGRAGRKGIAITFISPSEYRKLMFIQKIAKTKIRKEQIPRIADIVNIKKSRIQGEIERIIDEKSHIEYLNAAKNILKEDHPEEILAAIIKYSFDREFDESRYREISDISVDRKGTTRLFVSLGKKDGMMPRKLVKLINNESKIPAGRIHDVKILESFSFLTVSFEDAEVILKSFNSGKGRKQAIVQKANESKDSGKEKKKKKKSVKKNQ